MAIFPCLYGVRGILPQDNKQALMTAKFFNFVMLFMALLIAFQWHYSIMQGMHFVPSTWASRIVWLLITLEFATLFALTDSKLSYILSNWLKIIIIFLGMPVIFQLQPYSDMLLRWLPLLVVILLIPWVKICYDSLSESKLLLTLLIAFVIMLLAGIFISVIDPNIKTLGDGVWWAWVTLTTVGYGDEVPTSLLGRLFGAFLILMGLGLFSVITANFSVLLIQRDPSMKKEILEIHGILRTILMMKKQESGLIERIEKIESTLNELKQEVTKPGDPRPE